VKCLTDGTPNTWILILFPASLFDNFLWKYVANYGHLIVHWSSKRRREEKEFYTRKRTAKIWLQKQECLAPTPNEYGKRYI